MSAGKLLLTFRSNMLPRLQGLSVHTAVVYVIQTALEQQDQDGTAVPS
jgi:hypothetical protein